MSSRSSFLHDLGALTREKNRAQPSESEIHRTFRRYVQARALQRRAVAGGLVAATLGQDDLKQFEDALRHIGKQASQRGGHHTIKLLGEYDNSLGTAAAAGEAVVPVIFDVSARATAWGYMEPNQVNAKTGKFPYAYPRQAAKFIPTQGDELDDDTGLAGGSVLTSTQLAGVLSTISLEWIEDAGLPLLEQWLGLGIEAINALLDGAFLKGDGTANSTYGGITGVIPHASVPIVTAAAGNTTVQTLDRADLVNVISAVEGSALQYGARFFCNPSFLGPLLNITNGAGRPVVQTSYETGGEEDFILVGQPLTLTAGGPTTNSAGQKVLCFGRPGAYAVGVTRGIEITASTHRKFSTGGIVYRILLRAGGKMKRAESWAVLKTAAV